VDIGLVDVIVVMASAVKNHVVSLALIFEYRGYIISSPGSIVPFCKRTLVMLQVSWKEMFATDDKEARRATGSRGGMIA
jgi:hypothetical protein